MVLDLQFACVAFDSSNVQLQYPPVVVVFETHPVAPAVQSADVHALVWVVCTEELLQFASFAVDGSTVQLQYPALCRTLCNVHPVTPAVQFADIHALVWVVV